eukprot:355658-Chlamydomonas_euryale.AAC.14
MVCRRCAMVSTVQSENALRMVRWMSASVDWSTLDVACSAQRMQPCPFHVTKRSGGALNFRCKLNWRRPGVDLDPRNI